VWKKKFFLRRQVLARTAKLLDNVQTFGPRSQEKCMAAFLQKLWTDDQGQDIAEYAVLVAAILIIVIGTIRLIGTNSNTVFSNVASSVQ
jgi:Flp pilus assembly pilin Flp